MYQVAKMGRSVFDLLQWFSTFDNTAVFEILDEDPSRLGKQPQFASQPVASFRYVTTVSVARILDGLACPTNLTNA